MRRRAVALAAVLAFVPACAGDDGDDVGRGGDRALPSTTSAPATSTSTTTEAAPVEPTVQSYPVRAGSRPHDVWAASDGSVWYTGQAAGVLGVLNPASGEVREIPLGSGSRPHGVIEGPDGAAWVTDGGLDAIVRVDTASGDVQAFPLPGGSPNADLNTATFHRATLWFTGQAGVYGHLRAGATEVEVFDAPGDRGPYGITATADAVYFASLAGSYVGRIHPDSADVTVLEPPTPSQGTRRVWADSKGRVWSSQWDAGQVAVYDPATDTWREWRLPGDSPRAYAVYVDERDLVWLSDFGANALVSFDPDAEEFRSFPLPSSPGDVRQIHGRPGEVWGAESAADRLVVIRTARR